VETVQELLEYWVGGQLARTDVTADWQRNCKNCGRHLASELGAVSLDRIDRGTLERYRESRLRLGFASGTVQQDFKALHAAWRWGREMGLCPDKNLPHVYVKVVGVREKNTPSRDEVVRVIQEIKGWPHLAVLLLFATGARIGEVATLRWCDVDPKRLLVRVRGKTGYREIPIGPQVLEAIQAEAAPGGPEDGLFGVSSKYIRAHLSAKYIRPACERAGVRRFTPHALRRAAVDAFMRAGVDIGTAAAITGHSPQVMLKYYRQATDEDCRRAITVAQLGLLQTGKVVAFPSGGSRG
jgi:integrase